MENHIDCCCFDPSEPDQKAKDEMQAQRSCEVLERQAHYDKEFELIWQKWKDHTYLEGIEETKARVIAVVLENQSLLLGNNEKFSKVVMDLTAKIWREFIGFDLVQIQPMLGPVSSWIHTNFRYNNTEVSLQADMQEVCAKTRNLKILWTPEDLLDLERLAIIIRNDITREILSDLRNNTGTIASCMSDLDHEGVCVKIMELSGVIHRKTLRGGVNWLVTSSKIARILNMKFDEPSGPTFVGTINGVWKVFVDPLFPDGQILMGNNALLAGSYVYMPYVPLTSTPTILDQDFKPSYGLMTRYGKYLGRNGAKHYAKLNLLGSDEAVPKS